LKTENEILGNSNVVTARPLSSYKNFPNRGKNIFMNINLKNQLKLSL